MKSLSTLKTFFRIILFDSASTLKAVMAQVCRAVGAGFETQQAQLNDVIGLVE